MNKALFMAAAAALAFSGSALAKGGSKTGATSDAYIDKNAQISAQDCEMLSVGSARSACMRQPGGSVHGNVGATSGSGMGQGGSTGASDSGARSPLQQGPMPRGTTGQNMQTGTLGSADSGPRSPAQQGR